MYHRGGRLCQQYVVDGAVQIIEDFKLSYQRNHQSELRAALLSIPVSQMLCGWVATPATLDGAWSSRRASWADPGTWYSSTRTPWPSCETTASPTSSSPSPAIPVCPYSFGLSILVILLCPQPCDVRPLSYTSPSQRCPFVSPFRIARPVLPTSSLARNHTRTPRGSDRNRQAGRCLPGFQRQTQGARERPI